MGSWGAGVFENDVASDYLGALVRQVIKSIEKDLSTMSKPGRRGELERPFVAALAILEVFGRGIPSTRFSLRKTSISRWKQTIFEWFDGNFVPACAPTHWEPVRRDLQRCLDYLESVALDESYFDPSE